MLRKQNFIFSKNHVRKDDQKQIFALDRNFFEEKVSVKNFGVIIDQIWHFKTKREMAGGIKRLQSVKKPFFLSKQDFY